MTRWCRGPAGRQQRHSWTRGDSDERQRQLPGVNTTVLSVCAVEAPIVMTSAAFDERLTDTYQRVGSKPGMLEKLAGVVERRWWPEDVTLRRRRRDGGREGPGRGRASGPSRSG